MTARLLSSFVIVLAVLGLMALPAAAHPERPAEFPAGDQDTPVYRFEGPTLVVCKDDTAARVRILPEALRARNEALLERCQFDHLNEAIAAVEVPGTRILMLPGVYREEPYVGAVPEACSSVGTVPGEGSMDVGAVPLPPGQDDPEQDEGNNDPGSLVLTYEEQHQCPYLQNLVPILGDTDFDGVCDGRLCDLQIEGTGHSPLDTVIDGDYSQLNGIRADRADGLYLRNLTVQRFEFNAIYILESDGFVFDRVVTRWNDEYGFLSFAVDHGLYTECEGYGNGDSVVYPGSATDLNQGAGLFDDNEDLRFGTEVRGCRAHHSVLGYSGTAGNSVHTHHNEFDHNSVGAAMDSLFPDHPGLPQDHAYFHDNVFHSNNTNYYPFVQDGETCQGPFRDRDYDEGVVCPVIPLPVGTGLVLAGGNYNLYERNRFYDNWRQGGLQFFVPAALRGEEDPTLQFDTSHFNTWRDNLVGVNRNGLVQPNGTDFVWDGEGEGNCWAGNTGPDGAAATTAIGDGSGETQLPTGGMLPPCDNRPPFTPGPGIAPAAPCADYHRSNNPDPEGCRWFSDPPVPDERQPAGPTVERLAGSDRIGTSVLTSREAFPGSAEAVVLARSDDFADALAGAPLAAHVQAPLLMTRRDGLDPAVADEISRLQATRAYLLGGEQALSSQVEADLAALGVTDVIRIGGGDRFDTAVQIARAIGSGNVFLVNATSFADALSAAAVGALLTRPLLLTPASALPPSVEAFLREGQVVDVLVIGGERVVSAGVEASLATINPAIRDVERTAGANRLETSRLVADLGVQAGQDPTDVWLATAGNWPDALGAAAASAVDEGVLLLVDPGELTDDMPAAGWLDEHGAVLENLRIVGGPAAIGQAVEDAVLARTGGTVGDVRGDRSDGTTVAVGQFAPLPGAPAGYLAVDGVASMRRTVQGTTELQVTVQGLPPNTATPAHVHVGSCADGPGGHFQFDPAGGVMPPNEIHPRFTTDPYGVGVGSTTAYAVAGNDARSVVLHDPDGNMVACADLVGPAIPDGAATQPQLAAFVGGGRTLPGPWWGAFGLLVAALLVGGCVRRRTVAALLTRLLTWAA
ncbi:MAG: cell wall-binding repeat-containing protein [Actinobacteria bacterium]|nr:cell wall-binding repeat-containing protein [Actinomycetota bacterium]